MVISWIYKKPSALGIATGAVAGLVAITPASGFVGPLEAIVIGIGAGVVCYYALLFRVNRGIDESLDAWAVHGMGGTWGAIATGIFASTLVNSGGANGLLHGNPSQLGVQFIAVAATWIYAFAVTFILAKVVDSLLGLRVREEEEEVGLDISQHGEWAYS
jgi:Amt family ammonium transporter